MLWSYKAWIASTDREPRQRVGGRRSGLPKEGHSGKNHGAQPFPRDGFYEAPSR